MVKQSGKSTPLVPRDCFISYAGEHNRNDGRRLTPPVTVTVTVDGDGDSRR